ncbi:hypothetical protein DFJ74DRAFT_654723 [Hyaloraphidium curvatum]|nr:hypothetical protein DFJ74DRAFT_654723 [Hyaloraphidium curvatum]
MLAGRWTFRVPGMPKLGTLELVPAASDALSGTYALRDPSESRGSFAAEESAPGTGILRLKADDGSAHEFEYAYAGEDALEVDGGLFGGRTVLKRGVSNASGPSASPDRPPAPEKPAKRKRGKSPAVTITDADVNSLLARAGVVSARQPPPNPTALVGRWWTSDSYRGGTGYDGSGGYSSETRLMLSGDGSYESRAESLVSINVPGLGGSSVRSEAESGSWRVVDEGWIEFRPEDGGERRAQFLLRGGELELDGLRFGRV